MAYQKHSNGKGKKVWITLLVIVLIIVAVIVGVMIGRSHSGPQNMNYTKGGPTYNAEDFSDTTKQEKATVETTVDSDNKVVQVNMAKATQLAASKYPGYDFELEALRKGSDGRFYYQLEGVDSHGNVKDVRVDALSGAVTPE